MDYEIQEVPEGTYAVIKRTVAFSDVDSKPLDLILNTQGS